MSVLDYHVVPDPVKSERLRVGCIHTWVEDPTCFKVRPLDTRKRDFLFDAMGLVDLTSTEPISVIRHPVEGGNDWYEVIDGVHR
jgi:hypothetical protein